MPKSLMITSAANPKIKLAKKLRERRAREKSQLFLIEGYREIMRAASCHHPIAILFFCPELFLGENEFTLIESIGAKENCEVFRLPKDLFENLSYRDRPDGLLAIAPQVHQQLMDLKVGEFPFYIVAEAIEKPGNLGTILRTADAVGVNGAIICDRCTDLHNPNVVRASVGTLFTVNCVESSSEDALKWLKERKIPVIAATPSAKLEFTAADFSKGGAIVVGTEQLGLSSYWMEHADLLVKIPMNGQADSLNVAMATTLLLYEVLRQKSTYATA